MQLLPQHQGAPLKTLTTHDTQLSRLRSLSIAIVVYSSATTSPCINLAHGSNSGVEVLETARGHRPTAGDRARYSDVTWSTTGMSRLWLLNISQQKTVIRCSLTLRAGLSCDMLHGTKRRGEA